MRARASGKASGCPTTRGVVTDAVIACSRSSILRRADTTARVDTESPPARATLRPISAYISRAACIAGRHSTGNSVTPTAARL